MNLYLNVPYTEKDKAKKLGAKWNPKIKKWYIDSYKKYLDFSKWLLKDTDEIFLKQRYYILNHFSMYPPFTIHHLIT